MTTYSDDLHELRKKFNAVDQQDPDALRRWFDTYEYLSTNDHAQIANRSAGYIRKLKLIAGIKGAMPANLPVSKSVPKIVNILVPDDWDNPEWLGKMVRSYSTAAIAKAVGMPRRTLRDRLKRYNITDRLGSKPRNKHCTRDWCVEHYVTQGLNQTECAKLAGICQQVFANWLNRFKIAVRTSRETEKSHTNVRLWVRELFHKLQEQPTVRKVYLREDHIHVRFMNYFWETYYVNNRPLVNGKRPPLSYVITKQDAVLNKVPSVFSEYEDGFAESAEEPAHIAINRSELKSASLIEKRLAAHEYCRRITQRGWIWPEYPASILQSELEKIQNHKEVKYLRGDTFTAFSTGKTPALGRRIIEHFFDLSEFSGILRSPRLTMKLLNKLLTRTDLAFNLHNLLRMLSNYGSSLPSGFSKHPTFLLSDPALYAVIFERLGIKGTVLDFTPGFGNRAIACALKGLKYTTIPDERFNTAIEKGFDEFIGLDYEEYDGRKVDLLLCDNNFKEINIPSVLKYADRAKNMMIFVPHSKKLKTQAKYKPKSVIKVKTRYWSKVPDYIFIW